MNRDTEFMLTLLTQLAEEKGYYKAKTELYKERIDTLEQVLLSESGYSIEEGEDLCDLS